MVVSCEEGGLPSHDAWDGMGRSGIAERLENIRPHVLILEGEMVDGLDTFNPLPAVFCRAKVRALPPGHDKDIGGILEVSFLDNVRIRERLMSETRSISRA